MMNMMKLMIWQTMRLRTWVQLALLHDAAKTKSMEDLTRGETTYSSTLSRRETKEKTRIAKGKKTVLDK